MQRKESNESWSLVIKSDRRLFDIGLLQVWEYRDLLAMFVKRDFVAFYKQTILGPIWFFIQPLFTMAVYIFVFGSLAGISTDGLPAPLFYLAGISTWTYFSECLLKTSTVFRDNAAIFGKVYFPRLIMPLSIVVSNLVRFGITFALVICAVIYYAVFSEVAINFSWYLLFVPWLIVLMGALGLGLGMIVSALTTKYRDLALLVTFGVQLLMYSTTIVYPLSSLAGSVRNIVELNPLTGIVEGIRKGLLGVGTFDLFSLGYTTGVTFFILVVGILIYNNVERSFVDTI